MNCTESKPLVPNYLDGELSEDLSSRLRKHLLACQACRAFTQDEKAFRGWFLAPAAVAVPSDFAARVARRAFAGDTGEREVLLPQAPLRSAERETPILRFALRATAVAAGLLFVVALALGTRGQPRGDRLHATDGEPLSKERVIEALEALETPGEPAVGEAAAKPTPRPDESPATPSRR